MPPDKRAHPVNALLRLGHDPKQVEEGVVQAPVEDGVHLGALGGEPPGKGYHLRAQVVVFRILDQQRAAESLLPVDGEARGSRGLAPPCR